MRAGWPLAAVEFAEAARTLSQETKRQTNEVDSLRWLATIEGQRGQTAAVRRYLSEARAIAGGRHDAAWTRLGAEIDFAEAVAADPERTAEAIAASDRALAFFQTLGAAGLARLPELYLARGRLFARQQAWGPAESNLHAGLDVLSSKRSTLPSTVDGATLSDVARRFGEELVGVSIAQGHDDAAFMAIETLRGWDLPPMPAVAAADLLARIPANTVVLSFVIGNDRSYVWTATTGRLHLTPLNADRRRLSTLVASARAPRFDPAARAELRRVLIDPVNNAIGDNTVVAIVPDGPLHLLSFPALPGRSAGFWIEEHPIVVAPNMRWLLDAGTALREGVASNSLTVGNPSFDRALWPRLGDLPHSGREAAAIQSTIGGTLLSNDAATYDAVVGALASARRFHFGGHALVNDFNAGLSSLILAGDRPLTAADIRRLDLRHLELAVLASCDSARGFMPRADGPLGLTRAFLAAGTASVISALWEVDDAPSAEFFIQFHRAVERDGPIRALQSAQIGAIHSSDPARRAIAQWGAFTAISKLTQTAQHP
jgi:CHAT domain-containing protein